MHGEMNLLMLICAAAAAMALGVILGYGCCKALFLALRVRARSLSSDTVEPVIASNVLS
jgi:membrane protein DedA with SNARE-associated domain